jgi:hypothetical protein
MTIIRTGILVKCGKRVRFHEWRTVKEGGGMPSQELPLCTARKVRTADMIDRSVGVQMRTSQP